MEPRHWQKLYEISAYMKVDWRIMISRCIDSAHQALCIDEAFMKFLASDPAKKDAVQEEIKEES